MYEQQFLRELVAPRTARWLLALAAFAFLLTPGHRCLPLSGLPLTDLWFFVAGMGWALVCIACPLRPLSRRRAAVWVGVWLSLCGAKWTVGQSATDRGLVGTYETIVPVPTDPAALAKFERVFRRFRGHDANGEPAGPVRVPMTRVDRHLDFVDNSFTPFRQSFNLLHYNTRPMWYLHRRQSAAAAVEAVWRGHLRIPVDGEYAFSAGVVGRDRYTITIDGRHGWSGGERREPLSAGVYALIVRFEHAAVPEADSEKDERPMRFQLCWTPPGRAGPEPVPWHVLGRTPEAAARGEVFGWIAIAVLALAGGAFAALAIRQVAWRQLWAPGHRVRGVVFALFCLQLGVSTFMMIRHTTARPHWNVFENYDDKNYERRAQIFLKHGWLGDEARYEGLIHRGPIMEFYLPALHLLVGDDYGRMIVLQNVFMALIVPLAYGAGRLLFRLRAAGLAAAVLVALDPIFSELGRRLLPEALAAPLTLASIWLLLRTRRRGRWIDAAGAGVCIGLLVLARVNMVSLIPGAALLLLWPGRIRWTKRFAQAATVFSLAFLCWLPVPIRQQQLSGQWHWMPSQGPGMLVVGNIPGDAARRLAYHETLVRWARDNVPAEGHLRDDVIAFADNAIVKSMDLTTKQLLWDPLSPTRLQRINPYLTRFMIHYATAHSGEFLAGMAEKLGDFWWTHPSKGEHFRVHTILFLLAAALWLVRLGNVRVSSILLMIAATCGVLVLSYFEERHRSPVVPMIDVLSAGSVAWLIVRLGRKIAARRRG
jgi:4-amino-4-deoxy-L-arabinose transferase-like glycosyltransferase